MQKQNKFCSMLGYQNILEKIVRILDIEKKRYKTKGIRHTTIGLLLIFGLMQSTLIYGRHIWPQTIASQEVFMLVGAILVYYIAQTLSLLLFLPAYLSYTQMYSQFKIAVPSKEQPISKTITKKHLHIINKLLINQLIILPVALCMVHYAKIDFSKKELPNLITLFFQTQFISITEELLGFLGHIASHKFSIFSGMHKIHHEFNNWQWWVSQYFHPLEPTCSSLIISQLIFIISGNKVHCIVIFFWIAWKNMVNTQNHAGYQFQWSPTRVLPFIAGPSYHVYHHHYYLENYAASYYIWDVILGTNSQYMNNFLKN